MNNRFLQLEKTKPNRFAYRNSTVKNASKSMFKSRKGYSTATTNRALELSWPGGTAEQLQFMRDVYNLNYNRKISQNKVYNHDVPEDQIGRVEGVQLRAIAVEDCKRMLVQARNDFKNQGLNIRIGLISGYRSATRQLEIWQDHFLRYYDQTKRTRTQLEGGEHGVEAKNHLAKLVRKGVAIPGFSNHNHGLAVDLINFENDRKFTNKTGKSNTNPWRSSKFYNWLKSNAAKYNFYENTYIDEPWHWVYRQPNPRTLSVKSNSQSRNKYSLYQSKQNQKCKARTNNNKFSNQQTPAVAVIGEAIAGASLGFDILNAAISNSNGDITWKLDRLTGVVYPYNDEKRFPHRGIWRNNKISVYRKAENVLEEISAKFEIQFQTDGQRIGNVDINNIGTNDAVGWGLEVEGKIIQDLNSYNVDGDTNVAAVDVRITYRFTRVIGSDLITILQYKLFGNGKHILTSTTPQWSSL